MWCGNADQLVVSRRYVIVNPEFLIESVWNISSVGQSHRLITGRSQVRALDVPLQKIKSTLCGGGKGKRMERQFR